MGRALLRSESSAIAPGAIRAAEIEGRTLESSQPKIEALLNFMRLDEKIHQERCLTTMSGARTQHLGVSRVCNSQEKDSRKATLKALAILEAKRKDLGRISDSDIMSRLQTIFESYCNKKRHIAISRYEMDTFGFLRLLRDTKFMDNKLTALQAESILLGVSNGKDTSPQEPIYIDFEKFLKCLKRLLQLKGSTTRTQVAAHEPDPVVTDSLRPTYGHRKSMSGAVSLPIPLTEDPEILAIARSNIVLFSKGHTETRPVDTLYTPSMMRFLRTRDVQLRRIFAWYASLDENDPQRTTWEWVKASSGTLGRTEFMLMLLNFQVLPVLLSKHEALEVFSKYRCESNPSNGNKGDSQSWPSFLEALACMALYIADNAKARIYDHVMGSPDDIRTLQRYVQCCHGQLHEDLDSAMSDAAYQRSQRVSRSCQGTRRSSALNWDSEPSQKLQQVQEAPWYHGCHGDPLLVSLKQQIFQQLQEEESDSMLAVMSRREDLRMKHALKRLHNSYKDVRTLTNNDIWPIGANNLSRVQSVPSPCISPQRQSSPQRLVVSPQRKQPNLAKLLKTNPDNTGITFYSGAQQIKTPKPRSAPQKLQQPWLSLPSLHQTGANHVGSTSKNQLFSYSGQPSRGQPATAKASARIHAPEKSILDAVREMDKSDAISFISTFVRSSFTGLPLQAPEPHARLAEIEREGSFPARGHFVPMSTPTFKLEPIELKDEHEAMRQMAEKLPAIKLCGENNLGGTGVERTALF